MLISMSHGTSQYPLTPKLQRGAQRCKLKGWKGIPEHVRLSHNPKEALLGTAGSADGEEQLISVALNEHLGII